ARRGGRHRTHEPLQVPRRHPRHAGPGPHRYRRPSQCRDIRTSAPCLQSSPIHQLSRQDIPTMLNRRIRALAIPTAAILLLAACGTNETNQEEPATNIPATEAEVEVEDKSDAWPIVEDEDGNIVENPEDEPVEDEAMPAEDPVSTDASGNVTAVEFGDGEILEFDMDAAVGDVAMSPGTRVYGLSENGGDFVIATEVNPVAELEEYRERAGGEPVTYMSVDVDNREGTENINMYQVAV